MKGNNKRQRSNFTIKISVLEELESLVPSGQRSEFVNNAIEEAMKDFARKKALESIKKLKKMGPKLSSEELVKQIKDARRY